MEDLKKIETQDPDEKSALDFLTLNKSEWKIHEQTEEYKISYSNIPMKNPLTKNNEEHLCTCLEVMVKALPEKVFKFMTDFNIRKSVEPLYKDGKLISETKGNPEIYIAYLYLKMGFMMSDRDFVVQKKMWSNYNDKKDHYLIQVSSIDHKDYPEKSKPVRGIFFNRVAYIKPGEKEGETHLTLCNCIDMKFPKFGTKAIKPQAEGMKKWLNQLKDMINKI